MVWAGMGGFNRGYAFQSISQSDVVLVTQLDSSQ